MVQGYKSADIDTRNTLIKTHLAMVDLVVDRMTSQVPAFFNREDMASAAMMGLIDAASRFDPAKGILFKTFAEHRIRGAIFDEVRKSDWFSRSLREKHTRISHTMNRLEREYGRVPEEEEVAAALDMSIDDYRQTLCQVCHLGCVSLHETLSGTDDGKMFMDNLVNENDVTVIEKIEASELTKQLAGHLATLSEKERYVISLYYYEELTQKEIAEVLEVSEGRISQLHSQALMKLKIKMSKR